MPDLVKALYKPLSVEVVLQALDNLQPQPRRDTTVLWLKYIKRSRTHLPPDGYYY